MLRLKLSAELRLRLRAVRSAGCRGKVWRGERGGVRWWRRKAATFEHGVWAGREAGMEASGQAGAAYGWRAAWGGPGWLAGCWRNWATTWLGERDGHKSEQATQGSPHPGSTILD